MKLIAIVGTNSKRSTNRILLHFMAKHFADRADIEVCEIDNIDAFDEPADKQAPQAALDLAEKIQAADGVIIATPEYDHAIPAALKSVLEWLSYSVQPFVDKPVMIVGASLGSLGSSRAQAHLRQILDAPELKARIMPGTEFLLGRSGQAFDEEGQLIYEDKVQELEEDFAEFMTFVEITNQVVQAHAGRKAQQADYNYKQ
ncbi:NADPH-dependent FMN reductase [Hutsoniella sourekii]|uniref:NADPH-dependent FMN reductase n=1 Tax=Hutsoniella sourekii TaxID=87650 RepID=UPI000489CDA6|nr:NADPH-dependent FMN reductase [Hutsoniella sourekii]